MVITRDFMKQDDWSLVILVDNVSNGTNASMLSRLLVAIHKRWAVRISVVSSTISLLPTDALSTAMAVGAVHGVYCGGIDGHEVNDGLSAARRVGASKTIFIPLSKLYEHWTQVLRFFVENVGSTSATVLNRGLGLLSCTQGQLDILPECLMGETYNDWYSRTALILAANLDFSSDSERRLLVSQAKGAPISVRFPSSAKELYVSEAGLNRLGGCSAFMKSRLVFGGVNVSDFRHVYQLKTSLADGFKTDQSVNLEDKKQLITLPSVLSFGEDTSLVVDVAPAHAGGVNGVEADKLSLPRQMLQIRGISHLKQIHIESSVVFISSNYNKDKYLCVGLYAVLMQTHPNVLSFVQDDCSTDNSEAEYQRFIKILPLASKYIQFLKNAVGRGTYWIRNHALYLHRNDPSCLGLVSDSDDVSTFQRALLHDSILFSATELQACFMDVVRVDGQYRPLRLDKNIERYGTASLAVTNELIKEVGYFENLKKNADTEFIERVKVVKGASAVGWLRYPVLFQVYDGNNLTADIYSASTSGSLTVNHDSRAIHIASYRKIHQGLKKKNVAFSYAFPRSSTHRDYEALGGTFLVDGYRRADQLFLVTGASRERLGALIGKDLQVLRKATADEARSGNSFIYSSHKSVLKVGVGLPIFLNYVLQNQQFNGYVLFDFSGDTVSRIPASQWPFDGVEGRILKLKAMADSVALVESVNPVLNSKLLSPAELTETIRNSFHANDFLMIHSGLLNHVLLDALGERLEAKSETHQ